ncbi:filament-like plant protein isoform X1 [Primulina eburnea]|uniref:filament-like plant protein isoform X1 n=1 Tax=Primulina eburnea TaxID=1245227 RepID=UPI003C6CA17E
MEKRKWLWKRKSSERSPGESESPGSISSYSDRHSDEQQDALRVSPNNGMQSSEVTSNLTIIDDEVKEHLRSLTEKLSAALVNVGAKEDLVKQHAKVAEEAVAGWEKAENEVAVLKQQLEVAVQQNLKLEVRVSHLDGALKECVRQLRKARDEQEQRISDAMVEKTGEWELTKAALDKRVLELQEQVEAARAEISTSSLEVMQKENSSLKQELESRCKDLEIIMMERDLSTQAAETASKQQLESIKKIAMLEAECRKLQAAARKSSPTNDHKSVTASYYRESETDNHSDGGERMITLDLYAYYRKRNGYKASGSDSWSSVLISELEYSKNEKPKSKTLANCGVEIGVMDDFLEMERLAALGDTKISILSAETGAANGESISVDNPLRADLERSIKLVTDMEKKLEKIEAEKLKLERALDDSHVALSASKGMLVESEIQLEELMKELAVVNEAQESLEYQLISMEAEARTMSSCVDSLKAENEKERSIAAEFKVKSQELEMELQQTKTEIRLEELQKELATVNEAKESLEYQLVIMKAEAKTMSSCVDSLKAENEKERFIAAEFKVKCQELEMELQQTKTEIRLEELLKELAAVNEVKESLEYQLISMEAEARTMSSCVDSLKAENEKERSIAAEFKVKCQELEMELQHTTTSNGELKLKKEDLVVAADKLAECQKTIASLGKQLQSLATLENFLIDTSDIPEALLKSTAFRQWRGIRSSYMM